MVHFRLSFCNKCRHLYCDYSYIEIPHITACYIATIKVHYRNNSDYFIKWDHTGYFLTKSLYVIHGAPSPFHDRPPSCQFIRNYRCKPFPIVRFHSYFWPLLDVQTLFIHCCFLCNRHRTYTLSGYPTRNVLKFILHLYMSYIPCIPFGSLTRSEGKSTLLQGKNCIPCTLSGCLNRNVEKSILHLHF